MDKIIQYEPPSVHLIEIEVGGSLLQTSNTEILLFHNGNPVEDVIEGDTSTWGDWG